MVPTSRLGRAVEQEDILGGDANDRGLDPPIVTLA